MFTNSDKRLGFAFGEISRLATAALVVQRGRCCLQICIVSNVFALLRCAESGV